MPRGKSLTASSLMRRNALSSAPVDDPMSSMGNLMDVMLVFAVALMLSIVAHFNVDLSPNGGDDPQELGEQMQPLEGELQESEGGFDESGSYEELGTAYRDMETGELYVVSE